MFTLKESEVELMRNLRPWLPKTIFDTHIHTRPEHLLDQNLLNPTAETPGETFSHFPWKKHKQIMSILFPDFVCKFVVFGFVLIPKETENNLYVCNLSKRNTNLVSACTATMEDCDFTKIKYNMNAGFKGLKIKIGKDKKKNNKITNLIDFYPKEVFELLNNLKSFAIIHLPENIFYNCDELIFLAKEYSNTAFIIAHMGNNFLYQEGFHAAINKIASIPNIFLDTSMVTDENVIASSLSILGSKRILYGSDAPYSYLRGRFCMQNGRICFDPETYFPWVDEKRYQSYLETKEDFIMTHINSLMAIKKAIKITKKDNITDKLNIFYQNILSLKVI